MISYKEAVQIIENNFFKIESEAISFSDAKNRVCAEKIIAPFCLPRFNNSSMDGFAISSEKTIGASSKNPVCFLVTNIIAAGGTDCTLSSPGVPPRTSSEIMTGAPLPDEFDCVVPIEDVKIIPQKNSSHFLIEIQREVKKSEYIRFKGDDFHDGETLIDENEILTNEKMMVLASFGIEYIRVKKKIKIAIFSTGKEIVNHGFEKLNDHQIYNSTLPYLKNVFSRLPAELEVFDNVPDDKDLFLETIKKIKKGEFHLIISTGAVSKGKWDLIPECLLETGAEILFHRVKIKPGKPILFAKMSENSFYFGLPGNPVSTAVGFRFFIWIFLRKCLGLEKEKLCQLKLDSAGSKISGMTFFLKSKIYVDANSVVRGQILNGQESFRIKPLSESNGWIMLSDHIDKYDVNDSVYFLSRNFYE